MKRQLLLLAIGCLGLTNTNAQNDPTAVVGDTGHVTFTYMGNTVTYTTVRGADGMVWLQQNLGATQVATSASDAAAYGDYFQWGRWDDGHQVSTSTTVQALTITPNDPSGIPMGNVNFIIGNNPSDWWSGGGNNDTWSDAAPSSTNGTDPCAALGPNWHLPTQAEFANAITVENITDVSSAFSSNLMFTAAGQREPTTGIMQNVGTYGQYWASTPSSLYGKAISFQPSAFNSNDDGLRSYGFSLRCLTTCTGLFDPTSLNGEDTVCENTLNTYTISEVNNANAYVWTFPTGWTVIGAADGSSVNVVSNGTGGTISAKGANPCDTTAILSMTVEVLPAPAPIITQAGNTLSTGMFNSYQWLLNGAIITGETNGAYTPTVSGDYQVVVTGTNGCSDTSAIFAVAVSVNNIPGAEKIQVYPNPAVNTLNINAPFDVNIAIFSIDGRLVMEQQNATQVDISSLPSGSYHIKLSDTEGRVVRIEKLSVLKH